MSRTTRFGIALGFVAAVGLAGAAFGEPGSAGPDGLGPGRFSRGGDHHPFGRIVTGAMTFQTDDGLVTRRIDAGTVTSVDGSMVTIERADGQTVSATASENTRVSRDGARAEIGDLETGDHVFILRLDSGEGLTVRAIHAISPEKMAEGTQQMRDRRARLQDRRPMMRERLREWRDRMRDERAREGRAQA